MDVSESKHIEDVPSKDSNSSNSHRGSLFEKSERKTLHADVTVYVNNNIKEKEMLGKPPDPDEKYETPKIDIISNQYSYYSDNDYGYLKIYHELKKDFEKIEHMKKFQQFRGKKKK